MEEKGKTTYVKPIILVVDPGLPTIPGTQHAVDNAKPVNPWEDLWDD